MSDPRLREPYFRFSEPTSWPRGVECVLDYDGYVLNDRRRLDRIFVESIQGLTGPDLVAEAEKNPDRDGETPSDATYAGWTLTLRGYVEAGTLETMRSLYGYVEDAFDDVSEERPLWFRWLDWRDFFVDSNALVDYLVDVGVGTVAVAGDGSGLRPTTTSSKSLVLRPATVDGSVISRFAHADGETTMRWSSSTVALNHKLTIDLRRTSATHKLYVTYDRYFDSLSFFKVDGGSPVLLALDVASTSTSDTRWFRVRAEGSTISYSVWDVEPPDLGGTPLGSYSYDLTPSDLALFPQTGASEWGFTWVPSGLDDRIEMLDVAAINKGDAIFVCRKAAQIEGDETQVDDRYRRTFAVALRNSSARMVSRKPTVIVAHPTDFALTFPADGSGLDFPADGSGLVFGSYLSDDVVNLGRSTAFPIIRIYGPMTNPVVLNPIDGKMIGVDGSIPSGDYYEFDCGKHRVVDSSGTNVYRNINHDTNWIQLHRGSNSVILGADSIVGDVAAPTATVVASTDVFTLSSHGLLDGQMIVVESVSGAAPIGEKQVVYVRDVTTNTFKVSEDVGGAALNVTANGSVRVYVDLGRVEFLYRHSSR